MPAVCRICLADNRSLRSVTNNLLLCFYEKLTNNKLNSEDSRPRGLCSFCYQKLLKFHIFFEMAVRSENIFSQLYESGCEVTREYIPEEYIDINAKQHLSVAVTWFVTNEDNTTNAGSQVAIKDELLPSIGMNVQVTTARDKLLEFQTFPEVLIKSEIAFKEDTSDQENDTEELLSENIHIDQFVQDDSSVTIKDEPLSSVDIKEEITTELDKLVEISYFPEQSTRSQFNCNNCNKMFKRKSKLISHIRNCHSQLKGYSSAKKHTGTTSLIEEKTIHNEKPTFSCNLYDKQFTHKSLLVPHVIIHRGKKPIFCHVCEKIFYYKGALKRHMRTHSGENKYACHECDKTFKKNSTLKKHVIIHTGLKLIACHVCDKQFNVKGNLVRHMRTHTHTDDKPFTCHVCHKQFNYKSSLVFHMRTHSDERPYACHECDKRFNLKSTLERHVRIHTGLKPFSCHECDKQFYQKGNLVLHMRTHSGEKPYACHECDKRFNNNSTLKRHVISHTGLTPFACHVCDKQFYRKDSLVSHLGTHTDYPCRKTSEIADKRSST